MTYIPEEWKPVFDYPGYEVSSHGRIRNVRTGYIQKKNIGKKGYVTASLWKGGKNACQSVRVLVAKAFLGPRPSGVQVNHIDGDKGNNAPINLEYMTARENMAHARRMGLLANRNFLTDDQVRVIRRRLETESGPAIAKQLGVSRQAIYRIKIRQNYDHVV